MSSHQHLKERKTKHYFEHQKDHLKMMMINWKIKEDSCVRNRRRRSNEE
jgi:hypothetical protein